MVLSSHAAEMFPVLFTSSAGLHHMCAVAQTFHLVRNVPEHHLRLSVVQHFQCALDQGVLTMLTLSAAAALSVL